MLEFRYSNMLTVLSVAFFYSAGLPILYPVACLFFIITYWTDKVLLLRFYAKPVMFDEYIARETLSYFKFILLLHVIGSLFMFGNTPILEHKEEFEGIFDEEKVVETSKSGD